MVGATEYKHTHTSSSSCGSYTCVRAARIRVNPTHSADETSVPHMRGESLMHGVRTCVHVCLHRRTHIRTHTVGRQRLYCRSVWFICGILCHRANVRRGYFRRSSASGKSYTHMMHMRKAHIIIYIYINTLVWWCEQFEYSETCTQWKVSWPSKMSAAFFPLRCIYFLHRQCSVCTQISFVHDIMECAALARALNCWYLELYLDRLSSQITTLFKILRGLTYDKYNL